MCVDHKWFEEGMGVCTTINFNFCAWYQVEIRFIDNPGQKETIDDIILTEENKVFNLLIRCYYEMLFFADQFDENNIFFP